MACTSPCVTCKNTDTFCITCESGYTKKGRYCLRNRNVGFFLVFNTASTTDVLNVIDQIVSRIKTILNIASTESISLETIQAGSVIVSGNADLGSGASDADINSGTASLNDGLVGSSIGGLSVQSVSTVSNGVSTDSNDDDNTMIIALAVAIPAGIRKYSMTQL